jgi:hypothetical protein
MYADILALISAPIDPLAGVPDPDTLRTLIREQVRRTELLRHLLRIAIRRERLCQDDTKPGKGAARD